MSLVVLDYLLKPIENFENHLRPFRTIACFLSYNFVKHTKFFQMYHLIVVWILYLHPILFQKLLIYVRKHLELPCHHLRTWLELWTEAGSFRNLQAQSQIFLMTLSGSQKNWTFFLSIIFSKKTFQTIWAVVSNILLIKFL